MIRIPVDVGEFFARGFEFLVETGHDGQVPDLIGTDVETSAEDCFEESACEGLWGFEA